MGSRYLHQRIPGLEMLPEEVRHVWSRLSVPSGAAEMLWRECVARRVLDAVGVTGAGRRKDHDQAVRLARVWFRFGADRDAVLDEADIEPEAAMPWIRALLAVKPAEYSGTTDEDDYVE